MAVLQPGLACLVHAIEVMCNTGVYIGGRTIVRTQLYLTQQEREGLAALSQATGRKQSDLMREAVDRLIEQFNAQRKRMVLDRAAGVWAKRRDLPNLRRLRSQWDRW